MEKTLIVYASRYGSTAEAARVMGMILGPARTVVVQDFAEPYRAFDFIVLMAPVYKGRLLPEMEAFIRDHEDWLRAKPLALICVALDEKDGLRSLQPWEQRLGAAVRLRAWLGGRLDLDRVSQEDRSALQAFARMTGYDLKTTDGFNLAQVAALALRIKGIREGTGNFLPEQEVRAAVEDFLQAHNTCTLCTGHDGQVRGTPIEYTYRDGCLLMFSEGGEKFARLLLNAHVSVSVYEPYTGFDRLAGLQITGKAEIVAADHPDYEQILNVKGFSKEKFSRLPVQMNVLRIRMEKAEFLWSAFVKQGRAAKQSCTF